MVFNLANTPFFFKAKRPINLSQVKKKLVRYFAVLGPLGNLLTPHLATHSFRTYYLILCLFPFFYISSVIRQIKITAYSIPFFIYCFISAIFVEEGDMPLFRSILLLFQFLFAIGASFTIQTEEETLDLVTLYLQGFFLSLTIGYLGYLGYCFHLLPLQFLEFFSVLTQMGYGLLRFSPGSYPNEYGILCSFALSLLTWKLLNNSLWLKIPKKKLLFLLFITGVALLLTTTRAAYCSYALALMYLAWKEGRIKQVLYLACSLFSIIFLILFFLGINMFRIFTIGFSLTNLEAGSAHERILIWLKGTDMFRENFFWGTGFASQPHLHNLYFQLLFELGVCGLIILIGSILLYFLGRGYFVFSKKMKNEKLHTIVILGLLHVLWFAATNHNLNHHLTWFIIFLGLALTRLRNLTFNPFRLQ
jgi:O-antigen ligase